MRTLIILLALAQLAACQSTPKVPETVTVVVEKYKPLPDWATKAYAKPQPVDGTVGAMLESDSAKGYLLDVLLCHRRLLSLLDKGEAVDPKSCDL